MEDDWDLHAVVRGCAAASSSSTGGGDGRRDFSGGVSPAACSGDPLPLEEVKKETALKQEEDLRHDLYGQRPFLFPESSEMTIVPSHSLPGLGNSSPLSSLLLDRKPAAAAAPPPPPFSVVNLPKESAQKNSSSSRPSSKKRKSGMKRVVSHVGAEEVCADVWSWRKYGQKPIKGSPYPRGYYRCSTSKGCGARKQVERNRSNPGMYIVTYTGDHNHPMPANRTSRHKLPPDHANLDILKPANDQKSSMEEEDSFCPLEDDFFDGLEGFAASGSCSIDDSPVEFDGDGENCRNVV
ncbi:WRKY transcription factor 22-like isoform X2 [Andrographis paniculata]|uniref:WRKY transcription factor 22-like isoform X2 n=1 Tax=Andrographis paniculata TaxID=175694 RepID=UPI0021E74D24|nr:WRKY transcription factor 22-like isoform X2 [Andrographis paniculata]